MKKIKYYIVLGSDGEKITVRPIIENAVERPSGLLEIPLSTYRFAPWYWMQTELTLMDMKSAYERCGGASVLREKNCEPSFYIRFVQQLFQSFRCGTDSAEIRIKGADYLYGLYWSDDGVNFWSFPINFKENPKLLYSCTIQPLYGECVPFLELYTQRGRKRLNLKTWFPDNPLDYEIIWHFLVQLSNGERHYMQLPICSANRWYQTIQRYFERNPSAIVSPPIHCTLTTEYSGYHPLGFIQSVQNWSKSIKGSSPAEVLLKLSSKLNFVNRDSYLQQILSNGSLELEFTGEVIWEDHRPK